MGMESLSPFGGSAQDCGGISGEPCQEREATGFLGLAGRAAVFILCCRRGAYFPYLYAPDLRIASS